MRRGLPPATSQAHWSLRLIVITALVGVAGGVAGIAVYVALQLIQLVVFGFPWNAGLEAADNPSPLGRLLALTIGGIVIGAAWWALRRWGRPTVSVQKAVAGDRMPAATTAANVGVQILAVGLGASIGKEVAPRELGAWFAQLITRHAGLTARETKILVACGAAAGLAAVYDVPLGGALFAVEVLLGELSFATALPAFATSAVAAFIARLVIPVETLYRVPHMTMSPSLTIWSIIVGPVLGVAGVGFLWLIDHAQGRTPRRWRILIALPLAFAIVGLIAVPFPAVLGNGRALGLLAMNQDSAGTTAALLMPALLMLGYATLKSVTTTLTIGAGAVGGTLTPSIAIGAAAGAGLGGLWMLVWPGSNIAAFAFIGAAAFLAATMRAPFAALVLVMEFTNQGTQLLIPALLAVSGSVAAGYVIRRRHAARPPG